MPLSADSIDRATYRRNPVGAILAVMPELEPLFRTYQDHFRHKLAENPLCPPQVMRLLAYDTGHVLWQLAANPQLDVAAMERIADEAEHGVEWGNARPDPMAVGCVLRNPRCPEHLMRMFSHTHPSPIANHPDCPPDLLHQFSLDVTDHNILCSVARHPTSTTETLLNLLDRRSRNVERMARVALAKRGPAAVRAAMLRTDTRGRRHLAELVDAAERRDLARDPDPLIRLAIAKVTDDVPILRVLAADPHGRVRRAASDRVMSELAIPG